MHVQLAFHQTLLNSRSVRFGELVRAEELSNFLNRADSSVISTEEVSKILGWKVQNKRLLGAFLQPAASSRSFRCLSRLGEALAATLNAGNSNT